MLERSSAEIEIVLRPAPDAVFALLDGRAMIFSEAGQKIFELDRVGAFIWCKLGEGASLGDVYRALAAQGIDEHAARQFTRQAVDVWIDRALLEVDWRMPTDCVISAHLGRHKISVRAANRDLLRRLLSPFCVSDQSAGGDGDIAIEAMMLDEQVFLRAEDSSISRCEVEALAPMLKAHVTERLIRSDRWVFSLHAASLVKDGMGLLLCGHPGAGKSTLTLQLVDAGFRYAGDDVALVGADGTICGVPFAITLKEGSWDLLSRLHGDRYDATHCRSDGVRVRYVPIPDAQNECFSTGWIIFLNRVASGPAELTAIDRLDSMKRLIENAFSSDGKLSQTGFYALKRMVAGAKSLQLTYCEAGEARHLLRELCNGKA
ncbi:serine/threonine protein kinase [Bradyrhizobium sp. WBAH42]|nr:serine/threonine protein kinase [Bradyrhizobium sp. WBAH30]MDD1541201.1 serine/threonine protein kinase [Bradyrhizobium sp. WBAH41]MDD1557175.1 serine/threonine protein kinase [Bradyrhizobium sp. WBAH23]MDD1563836.1 serine/threonine protein kinase [Bradyrhizobium sp. WBAH33]MDD1589995.1 serine/threonine protein kinase [Bradyrhizobium sp. WBAH42]NRB86892.1 serine/threonine protein kinase [Bradyrhizobium sp. WBAH10]QCJ94080.1 serine/threonine protein kinase [Bradyrhizobium yuanmingense]